MENEIEHVLFSDREGQKLIVRLCVSGFHVFGKLILTPIKGVLLPVICLILIIPVWIIQVLLFLPLLIICSVIGVKQVQTYKDPPPLTRSPAEGANIFNRVNDVSKIYGSNTRNVHYRWDLFRNALDSIAAQQDFQRELTALDFGAGSLRDTYELARLGFKVLALESSRRMVDEYFHCYDWSTVIRPEVWNMSPLDLDKALRFDVIIAFDVLEHLYELENVLIELRTRLKPDAVLLVTVPNKKSLFERQFRYYHKKRMRQGLPPDKSGIPHVQFKSPTEWLDLFSSNGFTVAAHDMTLGFFVNDCWCGFYDIAARILIEPFIIAFCRRLGVRYSVGTFPKLFYPAWLMQLVDRVDVAFKPVLKHRYGWNLFVLRAADNREDSDNKPQLIG